MELKGVIKKVLKEEKTSDIEFERLEKIVKKIALSSLDPERLPDNFYDIAVDVFNSEYGLNCAITFLMYKSFTSKESDDLMEFAKKIKKDVRKLMPGYFDVGISTSTSTIENYEYYKEKFYDERKK